jgi:hypothetical protein
MPGTSHTPGSAPGEVSHPDGCAGHSGALRHASRHAPPGTTTSSASSYAEDLLAERRLVGDVDGRLFSARGAAVLAYVACKDVTLVVVVRPLVGRNEAP